MKSMSGYARFATSYDFAPLQKTAAILLAAMTAARAGGNFPAETFGKRVIRADGIGGAAMLEAVLSLIPLDTYSNPNMMLMQLMDCDRGKINPVIWKEYKAIAEKRDENVKIGNIDRFAFYERAKTAYAVIATGEEAVYANIILKKGVIK